jgi:S-adenosylmethionine uptake transporter
MAATGRRRESRPMPAPLLMLLASLMFATMGVCVKLASLQYGAGEVVFYRSLIGALALIGFVRVRGGSLRTAVPGMHFWRSLSGVASLSLWFYSLTALPLATAMTLNYMSSVWMALFLIGGAVMFGASRVDGRLIASVLVGFVGVALVLQPTVDRNQVWHGLAGLLSGVLAAMAYLQVTALGRAGEPEVRVVFYFSLGGLVAGAAMMLWGGISPHTPRGVVLLLAIGALATAGQVMLTRAYAIGRVLSNASLQYLGILFSTLYGVLLFDDRITLPATVGVLLIVAAGLATTLLRARSTLPGAQDTRAGPPSQL